MEYLRRSRVTLIATISFGLAFVLWTWWMPSVVDDWWQVDPPAAESVVGQVAVIVAGATAPLVLAAVAAVSAQVLSRRRLFTVAGAIMLAWLLAWSLAQVVKELVARPRPESPFASAITQQGYAYPSAHVAVWSAGALMAATVASTMRRRVWPWTLGWTVAVVVVALDRLLMGAHHMSDVIGGVLLGLFAASLANLIADVHVVRQTTDDDGLSAAVIYNPVKVVGVETFRELVGATLAEHGYDEVLWLPTEVDDPGVQMARRALDADVDLVLVAGGDGTVRVVMGELADTGQALAILPSGTGNLLARNLGIPLDLERAMRLAVRRETTAVDLIEARLPDGVQHAAVLAGLGIDAEIMGDTDEALKKRIGVAAYVVAGAKNLQTGPMQVTITVDDQPPISAKATLVSVGNVGELQEGVAIMPDASAHDGLLDVLVATPQGGLDMAQMITDVLTEAGDGPNIARYTGRKVRLQVPDGVKCQIDGDLVGNVDDVTFEVQPGAVELVIPRGPQRRPH